MIILKSILDEANDWICYHKELGNNKIVKLNKADVQKDGVHFGSTDPTNKEFTINSGASINNQTMETMSPTYLRTRQG